MHPHQPLSLSPFRPGGGLHDSHVVKGMVLKRGVEGTISRVADAKVAVFAQGVDTSSTETKVGVGGGEGGGGHCALQRSRSRPCSIPLPARWLRSRRRTRPPHVPLLRRHPANCGVFTAAAAPGHGADQERRGAGELQQERGEPH